MESEVVQCVLCRGMLPADTEDVFLSHMRDQHRAYVNLSFIFKICFLDEKGMKKTTEFITALTSSAGAAGKGDEDDIEDFNNTNENIDIYKSDISTVESDIHKIDFSLEENNHDAGILEEKDVIKEEDQVADSEVKLYKAVYVSSNNTVVESQENTEEGISDADAEEEEDTKSELDEPHELERQEEVRKLYSLAKNDYKEKLSKNCIGMMPKYKLLCSKVCGDIKFRSESTMKGHMSRFHSLLLPVQCPVCPRRFKTEALLEAHMKARINKHPPGTRRVHLREMTACPDCGKKMRLGNLKAHQLAVHGREDHKKHICDVCGKGFTVPNHLKEHQFIHQDARTFPCRFENCKFASKSSCNRRKHELSKQHHGDSSFKKDKGND